MTVIAIDRREAPGNRWKAINTLGSGVVRFARMSPLSAASAVFLAALLLVAVFAGQLAPYEPNYSDFAVARQPPNAAHLLGTDQLGRDVLSRMVWGARVSLFVALSSVLLGDIIGFVWGVASGYLGGRFDLLSQRLLDILMAFPGLILALLLMVAQGPGLHTVIVAIAVTRVPSATRVIRAQTISVNYSGFVEAARALGATPVHIMRHHIAPQCVAPFIIVATANIGGAITAEASLSFLGVGIPPPDSTWGNMLGGILAEVFNPRWWLVVFPGAGLTLTVLAANLFGDGVRDFLDPILRRRA